MKKNIQLLQLIISAVGVALTLVLVITAIVEFRDLGRRLKNQDERDVAGLVRDAKEGSIRDATRVTETRDDGQEGRVLSGTTRQHVTDLLSVDWLNTILTAGGEDSGCLYEDDGECDALGFVDSTNVCPNGTDLIDCNGVPPLESEAICIFENDGECDAKGYWRSTELCEENTDTGDCRGSRLTSDVCRHENDGTCDAMGHPGSTNRCPVGTDRVDCAGAERQP